jgi:hypothetical protein
MGTGTRSPCLRTFAGSMIPDQGDDKITKRKHNFMHSRGTCGAVDTVQPYVLELVYTAASYRHDKIIQEGTVRSDHTLAFPMPPQVP